MIVDDHRPFLAVARRLVEATDGLDVVAEAASGSEAISLAAAERPTLVLMDVNLPDIDGFEATRRIVSTAPSTIVVLTSTYDETSLSTDPASCGAVCFIPKQDLTPTTLSDVLRRVITRRRSDGQEPNR